MKRLLMVATISRFMRDFLLPHARYFRAQGWQVDALCSQSDAYPECTRAFDRIWDIDWSRNPLDPRNFRHAPGIVRDLVEREGYQVVHVHTPVASFVTRYALRNLRKQGRVRVVYTAHGFHFHPLGEPLQNAIFLNLEKLAGSWTDYLVVINAEDHQAARRHRFVQTDRLVYMPGIGIDTAYYHPHVVPVDGVYALRTQLGIPPQAPLFTMVAEFNPGKRHADALQAFGRLAKAHPEAHLAFAGCGPLETEMQALACTLGVAGRTHFCGFRRDVRALVCASTALVLPSIREGLPRCIMEAMSLGVPSIGADIRGIRELVTDYTGLRVPVGDIPRLAEAMAWMIEHPDTAVMMGRQANRCISRYDLREVLQLHDRLYAAALGENVPVFSYQGLLPSADSVG